jgi:hypothetical protein
MGSETKPQTRHVIYDINASDGRQLWTVEFMTFPQLTRSFKRKKPSAVRVTCTLLSDQQQVRCACCGRDQTGLERLSDPGLTAGIVLVSDVYDDVYGAVVCRPCSTSYPNMDEMIATAIRHLPTLPPCAVLVRRSLH